MKSSDISAQSCFGTDFDLKLVSDYVTVFGSNLQRHKVVCQLNCTPMAIFTYNHFFFTIFFPISLIHLCQQCHHGQYRRYHLTAIKALR